jgi:hypothetical protein
LPNSSTFQTCSVDWQLLLQTSHEVNVL